MSDGEFVEEKDYLSEESMIHLSDQETDSGSELSHEEVLALNNDDSEDEDERLLSEFKKYNRPLLDKEDILSEEEEEEEGGWGRKKSVYYGEEESSDEEVAKQEEEEALKMQKSFMETMADEDFFDEVYEEPVEQDINALDSNEKSALFEKQFKPLLEIEAFIHSHMNLLEAPEPLCTAFKGYLMNAAFCFANAFENGPKSMKHPSIQIMNEFKELFPYLSSGRPELENLLVDEEEEEEEMEQEMSASESDQEEEEEQEVELDIENIDSIVLPKRQKQKETIIRKKPIRIHIKKQVTVSGDADLAYKEKPKEKPTLQPSFTPNEEEDHDVPDFTPEVQEYLDMVQEMKQQKAQQKQSRRADYEDGAQAYRDELSRGEETSDNKRKASWNILANKGLTPKRKKIDRNPRVKKRMRYEKAKKKLSSVKRVAVDKSKVGSYSGEKTGIKSSISRSVKL